MQNFKKIDRKKTKLFSIEKLIHCFCATLYFYVLKFQKALYSVKNQIENIVKS